MKLLLDTHALIWWFQGNEKLGAAARQRLDAGTDQVLASVVSVFEIMTKRKLGKLADIDELTNNFAGYFRHQMFDVLPLSLAHAELAGSLPIPHKDPFDRLLIAQAQVEQALLVSNEALFDQFGVRRLW